MAFDGTTDIPIVQVSLPGDGNPVSAGKLGKLWRPYGMPPLVLFSSLADDRRDLGYGIMGTGQVVNNLRDFCKSGQSHRSFTSRALAPFRSFAEDHTEAPRNLVLMQPSLRSTNDLFWTLLSSHRISIKEPETPRSDSDPVPTPSLQGGHPTPEHLLPPAVAVGATDEGDAMKEIWAGVDGGLGWGIWRWKGQ